MASLLGPFILNSKRRGGSVSQGVSESRQREDWKEEVTVGDRGMVASRKWHSQQLGSAVLLGCSAGLPDTRVSAGRVVSHGQLPPACHRASLGVEALVWEACLHTGAQPAPRPGRAQLVRWWAQSRAQGKDKGRVGSEGEWAPGNAPTGQASNKHRRGAWGGGARTAAGLPLRTCRPGLASMQLVAPWAPKKMPGAG